jgi:hypothetical protein
VTATGTVVNLVEVYTPGQACQKTLAPMPSSSSDPVLAFMSGTIILIESNSKKHIDYRKVESIIYIIKEFVQPKMRINGEFYLHYKCVRPRNFRAIEKPQCQHLV